MNLKLKQKLILMIRTLYFCMEDEWSELIKEYNVSPAQQHILFLLSIKEKPLTFTQISELGCWHISTVSRLLKPIEKKGLIIIYKDKKQPRYKNVELTDKGTHLLKSLINFVKDMDQFPFHINALSEEEVHEFLKYGLKIIDVHKGKEFRDSVINAQLVDIDLTS